MRWLTDCTVDGTSVGGNVEELFLEDGLPFVETLDLKETELNKVDIQSISSVIKQGKPPLLRKLYLNKNNFYGVEEVLEELFQACVTYYKRNQITISISGNDVSKTEEFEYKIDSLCVRTMVSLNERPITVDKLIHDLRLYSLTDSAFHTNPLYVIRRDIRSWVEQNGIDSMMHYVSQVFQQGQ